MQSSLWKLMQEHLGEQNLIVGIPFSCLFSDFTVWKFLLLLFMLCQRLNVWSFMSRPKSQGWEATSKMSVKRRWKAAKGENMSKGWEYERFLLWLVQLCHLCNYDHILRFLYILAGGGQALCGSETEVLQWKKKEAWLPRRDCFYAVAV